MNISSMPLQICLWFNDEAEEAASFYCGIFPDAKMGAISRYGKEGFEVHKKPEGTAMTVAFQVNGTSFLALNGGTQFTFNEAVSFMVYCKNQDEIDYYWNHFCKDGTPGRCGWLKDKYGVSWQIIPQNLGQYLSAKDQAARARVMKAMFAMQCFVIQDLENALNGSENV